MRDFSISGPLICFWQALYAVGKPEEPENALGKVYKDPEVVGREAVWAESGDTGPDMSFLSLAGCLTLLPRADVTSALRMIIVLVVGSLVGCWA